jgi:hypothetical protein
VRGVPGCAARSTLDCMWAFRAVRGVRGAAGAPQGQVPHVPTRHPAQRLARGAHALRGRLHQPGTHGHKHT